MKKILLFFLICYTSLSYAQDKSIAFFDDQKKPISNFQLNFFIKDSLSIYKSDDNHIYRFKQSSIKKIDSIFIIFDSFYLNKIDPNDFIKKDALFLKKDIALEEVVINTKIERKELGVTSKKKNLGGMIDSTGNDHLIALDASNYTGASVETVSLYLYKKSGKTIYNTKFNTHNLDIEFYLFQSNTNPNEGVVNLLESPLIVNTGKSKKGWLTIDLKSLDIKIKDLKHLYMGFSPLGNTITYRIVRREKITSTDTITAYKRNPRAVYDKLWKPPRPYSKPAIKIEVKY